MIVGTAAQAYEDVRTGTTRYHQRGAIALLFAAVAMLLTMLAPLTSPASAEWAPPSRVYIEQTGHTLDQVFLDVWRDSGRESSYGYPITPEITLDNGHIVQYLQYARFEYWPEGDAEGRYFHIGNIGEELRPISLPRSIAAWNSTGEPQQSPRSEESLRMAQAWLPVTNSAVEFSSRFVEETRHTVSGEFRDFWEATGEAGYLGNPLTEEYESSDVVYQVFERGQLQVAPGESVLMVPVGLLLAEKYGLDQSPVARGDLPMYDEALFVPPPEPKPIDIAVAAGYVPGGGEVWIDINLSSQYMVVYQGSAPIMETYISSGKSGFETPTGTFHISFKNGTQDMEGLIGGEYYNVKDVPSVMYFTGRGHAIHGAYWHNNFGAVMSHGCINVPVDLAEFLYEITPVGARVEIHF